MKILTKQYKYSPESLEIFLNGVLLKKDYYRNLGYEFYQSDNKIKFIRENILTRFKKINNKLVKIEFLHNKQDLEFLDKTYQGYVNNYNELKSFINKMKLKHNLCDNIKIKFVYKSNIKKGA